LRKKPARSEPKDEKDQSAVPAEAVRSLIEALVIMGVIVVALGSGLIVSNYYNKDDAGNESTLSTTEAEEALPSDIPAYNGWVLRRHTNRGGIEIFEFDLPQGSISSVHTYFEKNMEKNGWERHPKGNTYEDEYAKGSRIVNISLSYQSAKVHIKIRIETTQKKQ